MWAITKRVFFFTLVNILVMLTLTVSWTLLSSVLGIDPSSYYSSMMLLCLVFGMGGAFISLLLSKTMAKRLMGVQIIEPNTQNPQMRRLLETVHSLARQARLAKMPEVGIYDSPEVNAFATGPSKSNSLVAVSSGLLYRLNEDQVEGVLAHEVAHIANGDMVTMTLIQGVINALVMFAARILADLIAGQMEERSRPMVRFMLIIGLQILLGLLGSLVVNYFSRHREFRADAGGAKFAGKDKMISALQALQSTQLLASAGSADESIATLKISDKSHSRWVSWFSTHPPLEDRIRKLSRA